MAADLLLTNQGIQYAGGNIVDLKAAMPSSGSYTAGDIVLESTTGVRLSGWKRLTTGSNHVLNTDWAYFSNVYSSRVEVNTYNGYGSTNTVIMRFTNVAVNTGSDITYADSATLGNSFTINTAGIYSFTLTSGSNLNIGLSKNSAQLTTSITTITVTNRLSCSGGGAGIQATATYTGYFAAGDVVRAHTDGAAQTAGLGNMTAIRIA